MRKREEILADIAEIAEKLTYYNLHRLLWFAQGFQQIEKEDGVNTD